jgi:alkylated DNA repair protein (DNA oxidative demethylase)
MSTPPLTLRGIQIYKGHLSQPDQAALVETIRDIAKQAPFTRYTTPRGGQMSVRMTSAGPLGWVSDRSGYRYQAHHPSGIAWPPIPQTLLDLWAKLSHCPRQPESCLVNYYDADAKMGLHQDADEADLTAPVLSVSLGDDALFRIGNLTRGGKTESIWLQSGDVLVMGGEARMRYHGIDRLRPGSSTLLPKGGRINLTLRVVTTA